MENKKTTDTADVKKEVRTNELSKALKSKIKFTIVTKEELEKRRIPVYPYII